MISAQYRISRAEYEERERLKAFYNTPVGRAELMRDIMDGCLLGQIAGEDQIYKHNLAVKRLERIGLLDEENLEDLVKWMLSREPRKFPADDIEEM